MVLKPWGERKRKIGAIFQEVSAKLHGIPGLQMFGVLPSALPGGDNFPVEFVISSTADFDQILPLAQKIVE